MDINSQIANSFTVVICTKKGVAMLLSVILFISYMYEIQ